MGDIFAISDPHLGHKNILTFKKKDGRLLRPGFVDLDAMHECFFDRWNDTVRPGDKVYVLGDVAFGASGRDAMLEIKGLPGKKRLVRGNHDHYPDKVYHDAGFEAIYGVRQINGIWLTHVPMHTDSVRQKRVKINIHGHLHEKKIKHWKWFNASVEQINFTPVPIDLVLQKCLESRTWLNRLMRN